MSCRKATGEGRKIGKMGERMDAGRLSPVGRVHDI
jgi:hypothetical protein